MVEKFLSSPKIDEGLEIATIYESGHETYPRIRLLITHFLTLYLSKKSQRNSFLAHRFKQNNQLRLT
jgi:hypothetical protein